MEDQKLQTQTKPSEIKEAIQRMQESLEELKRIESNLLDLQKVEIGEEVLAPIANGIFIQTTLKSHTLKVNVGNGVVLEKNVEDTIKLLKKQEKEILKNLEKANKMKNV